MLRVTPLLALLVACGGPAPEAAAPLAAEAEVEMEATELMIPASHAEMLEEEILALREETTRLRDELHEAKAPSARKAARHAMATAELANAESELRKLRAELAETKDRLVKAEARNEVLTVELAETTEQLVQTEADLERVDKALRRTELDLDGARRIAADAGWSDLVSQTQVALCPKGGRKKLENCREDAVAAIAPVEPAARACLRSGQAAPQLQRAGKGDDMPRQAVWIGEAGYDYYVVLCDPTLPEARQLLASRSRRAAPAAEPVQKRTEPEPSRTVKTSYVAPEPIERARPVERPVERVAYEPDEPLDLLADDELDLASLGLMDLDGDADEGDDKPSRDEKRRAKKEKEELEAAARRRGVLEGAGDDLLDEDF